MKRTGHAVRKKTRALLLRPGITNPKLWYPDRPPEAAWERIRKAVLERDNYTCCGCGHRALKFMNVHHVKEAESHHLKDLTTVCVACHAVLHIGRNLDYGAIEIWQSAVPQVEIVKRTREAIKQGRSLAQIKKEFKLKRGVHHPKSIEWANELVRGMGRAPRAYLREPLSAVFVKFSRWQLE